MCVNWTCRCVCVCIKSFSLSQDTHINKYIFMCVNWTHMCVCVCVCGSDGKESACNEGDLDSILGLGRSPGEESGNLFQYSCLENSMDRRAWQAIAHGVTNSWTWVTDSHACTHILTNYSVQFSSVAQSCPTLCDPMNRSTPGLPVHHQLPEFTQTHVQWCHPAISSSVKLLEVLKSLKLVVSAIFIYWQFWGR